MSESLSIAPRKRYLWKLKQREVQFGDRTLIMGILNVTPDSFSDGGRYTDPDAAYSRALELEEAGADVIDIGAESTRPGSPRVSEAEEKRRLMPVLKRLRGRLSVPISIDTYKAPVAENALDLGAEIINDATGLTFDPLIAKVAAKYDAGLILSHMRGTPETWAKLPPASDIAGLVRQDLDACVHRARGAGLDRFRIVIDPGLGFGKRGEQNLEILAQLDLLKAIDLPVLVGPSRKQFLKQPTPEATEYATAAAVTAAVLKGAHMVRVHDVAAAKAVVAVADGVVRSVREE